MQQGVQPRRKDFHITECHELHHPLNALVLENNTSKLISVNGLDQVLFFFYYECIHDYYSAVIVIATNVGYNSGIEFEPQFETTRKSCQP